VAREYWRGQQLVTYKEALNEGVYLFDHLGNTEQVVDAAETALADYLYSAWGEGLEATGSLMAQAFQFEGVWNLYREALAGLQWLPLGEVQQPKTGRYLGFAAPELRRAANSPYGINEDKPTKIPFDPFTQADGQYNPKYCSRSVGLTQDEYRTFLTCLVKKCLSLSAPDIDDAEQAAKWYKCAAKCAWDSFKKKAAGWFCCNLHGVKVPGSAGRMNPCSFGGRNGSPHWEKCCDARMCFCLIKNADSLTDKIGGRPYPVAAQKLWVQCTCDPDINYNCGQWENKFYPNPGLK